MNSRDGYIDLSLFLSCNKFEKLNVNNTEILAKALEKSKALELSGDKR